MEHRDIVNEQVIEYHSITFKDVLINVELKVCHSNDEASKNLQCLTCEEPTNLFVVCRCQESVYCSTCYIEGNCADRLLQCPCEEIFTDSEVDHLEEPPPNLSYTCETNTPGRST